ncbi:MAG: hypothetical protein HN725_19645 [Alphaproteobacteria bacterium]|nr:hypothetical protein [Alphaproteobacteria bacterium]MBT4083548.1 hypothetical protein [Alphaproteobacteria bacterium]MBT4546679.1 hypothetical protein [Alphaproteobacteria bacterium]MBT7747510.1 hypothetical protein [Alphaproteobacteria bacterium]
MSSKYIILRTTEGEKAVIFPGDDFYHDDVARHFDGSEVVSAGFVVIDAGGAIKCFGKSTGLGIASRGVDDEIVIRHQLREPK